MENNEILEGKKTDNLEATSASEETEEVAIAPELNSSPAPTAEEVEDANVAVEPENVANESDPSVESENVVHEENGVVDTPALKTFTQSQVNDMVGNTRTETREKTFRYIYDRYGVNDEAELDELIGNAQRYDSLQEQYDFDKKNWKEQSSQRDNELMQVKEQVALMQSGIDSSRYEDAKFILKGKGLEINAENIQKELATHPEWQKKEEVANPNFAKKVDNPQKEPDTKISVLGNDRTPGTNQDEEDYVLGRMFKV